MLHVWSDGSFSRLSNTGGWAYVVNRAPGTYAETHGAGPLPPDEEGSNQRAEIIAAAKGILGAARLGETDVIVHTDSEYVVKTMRGEYRRKANARWWEIMDDMLEGMTASWVWHPRNTTQELSWCDAAAKKVRDDYILEQEKEN